MDGDVRQLTDETGIVTDSYRYNSYGELEETQGETENPYLYTGEYFDEGTGLYYLRARYMNPETGTFTSMDNYRGDAYDPASLHRYTYAQNNPQMYNDPSGHSIALLHAKAYMACSEVLRYRHAIHVMGMVSGMMNSIVNQQFIVHAITFGIASYESYQYMVFEHGGYENADEWVEMTLKKGDIVWGGAPGQSNFYTTNEVAQMVGNDATMLYQGLQVGKGNHMYYRVGFAQYKVNQEVRVAFSKALANSQISKGGFDQYFIPNYKEVLEPILVRFMNNI